MQNFFNTIYKKVDKLTNKTPLTPFGWFVITLIVAVPVMLGCAYVGYSFNSQLIELQSRTNGMDLSNYEIKYGDDVYAR